VSNPIPEVDSRNRLIAFLKNFFAEKGSTTPAAGSNTQIQFNDGGVFGASSNLTFEGSILNCTASVGIEVGSGSVHIGGDDGVTLFDVVAAGSSGLPTFCIVEMDTGFGTATPKVHLDVNYGYLDDLSSNTGGGDWVTFGSGTTVAGKLYYLKNDGVWTAAQADAIATGATQLLAIALGTDAADDGMLLRGFFQMTSYLQGTWDEGIPIYVSDTHAGQGDIDIPADDGDFVRVIGYCGAGTINLIYFNPSSTYIEIS
jgi:hypothetical protein